MATNNPSSVALLVDPPECHDASRESSQDLNCDTLKVESERCQSVDLENSNHLLQNDDEDTTRQRNTLAESTEVLSSTDSDTPHVETPTFTLQSIFRGIANATTANAEEQERELVQVERAAAQAANNIEPKNSLEYGYKYDFGTAGGGNEENDNHHLHDETETTDHDPQHIDSSWTEQASYLPTDMVGLSSLLEPGAFQIPSLAPQPPQHSKMYVLGKQYDVNRDYEKRRDEELALFWFTYRCDFPEIVPYRITSDAGWGCMLRSAQMMLAQALRVHLQSRDYKSHTLSITQRRRDPFLRSLLTWFADFPSALYAKQRSTGSSTAATDCGSVYSLHNMVATGNCKYEVLPGEWYGPGTSCYVLRDLVQAHEYRQIQQWAAATAAGNKDKMPKRVFRVHVASQGAVYKDAIGDLMTREHRGRVERKKKQEEKNKLPAPLPEHPLANVDDDDQLLPEVEGEDESQKWDTALLLLIPLRLGLDGVNEDYAKSIAHMFSFPQSVGVLGGRPRGARWFYGATADGTKILGLDPHTVQNAPRRRAARVNGKVTAVVDISEDYLRSVHTTRPETVPLLRMDPSIALGFYCASHDDLDQLSQSMQKWKRDNPKLPELFTISDTSPLYASGSAMHEMISSSLLDMDDEDDEVGGGGDVSDEDEYVML